MVYHLTHKQAADSNKGGVKPLKSLANQATH